MKKSLSLFTLSALLATGGSASAFSGDVDHRETSVCVVDLMPVDHDEDQVVIEIHKGDHRKHIESLYSMLYSALKYDGFRQRAEDAVDAALLKSSNVYLKNGNCNEVVNQVDWSRVDRILMQKERERL